MSMTPAERLFPSLPGSPFKRASGISLIEMLIALLVLSFGLLGLAGLQAYSLRNNSGAYYRSIANALAYDIVDRMRANRAVAVAAGTGYNITLATNKPAPSATDVRQQDQFEWLTAIETLPGGDGAILCNSGTRVCQVTVQWDDSRGAGVAQQFVLSAEL